MPETPDEQAAERAAVLRRLDRFRAAKRAVHDDIRTAAALGVPETEIVRRSGYSRSGVRKVLGKD